MKLHNPDDSPRIAIYARQSADESQGIRQQIHDCRAEAKYRGWQVLEEYCDNDTSASKLRGSGTQWAAMLKGFDAGEFDAVLANDVDRLTRNLGDVLELSTPRRNIRVLTVRGGIDTAIDDFMFKQLVLLAEREVKLKAVRAQRYALERRAAGHPTPGMSPHGYKWVARQDRDEKGTRYVIDPNEAPAVKQIFNEFLAGAPLGQIARDLNAEGRLTRKGTLWRSSTTRRILLNPNYAALLAPAQASGQYDPTTINIESCVPGAWEPLVDVDQLLAARGRLIGVKPNHDGTARKWLLAGLAVCGVCRAPVRSARGETHPTAKKDGSGKAPSLRYHAYRCVKGHFMRNGDLIDSFIAEVCIERLSQPDALALIAPPADTADIAVLHSRRVELQGRDTAIAGLIASGKMSPMAAEQALDDLANELRTVNAQIAKAIVRNPLAELAGVEDVRAWWEKSTLARRRAIVDLLMVVVINRVGYGRRVTTLDTAAATIGVEWRDALRA
ncbi:recombinase family protein [Arthrobacter sp. GMC3]|uniref:recombinase family protein n=1 Tax=Arthrobacter sp. GMC3 TaxID=2058894 RepID=UPI000CE43EAD|nr:recombinase family protein [Arthrobacter sp. GMC3]